jgi:murein DD-endopeptidase MepM/ murein hydrolase activator NlpD
LNRTHPRGRSALALILLTAAVSASGAAGALAASGSGGIGPDGGATASEGSSTGVFPVRGHHTYGDGLGAGRGHQGVDVMAKCGKAIVAAQRGRVKYVDYQASGAGHYVVIDGKGRLHDTVYMHLSKRPSVREGERVSAGRKLGRVGMTGNTSACHLHFEMWSPTWSAGKPVDPEPYLRRWDKKS